MGIAIQILWTPRSTRAEGKPTMSPNQQRDISGNDKTDWHESGTSTNTNSIANTWPTAVAPCKKLRFTYKVLRGFASVSEYQTWEHKIVCHEVANGQPWVTNYYNPGTLSGNAQGICDRSARFDPDGVVEDCHCCGGDDGGDDGGGVLDPATRERILEIIDENIDFIIGECDSPDDVDDAIDQIDDLYELHSAELGDEN